MTPAELATMHAAAFDGQGPWSAAAFEGLLSGPHVQLIAQPQGFALVRTVAGESELLTLAVHPDARRQGIARTLIRAWLGEATAEAESAFLEVAADNLPARALYAAFQFEWIGTRPAYYPRELGPNVDAILMKRRLTSG